MGAFRTGLFLIPACAGALAGLDLLREAGWSIGLVTNGFEDVQLRTMSSSGIGERVDGWAISGAEGVRKPGRRLFEIAAERSGRSLAEGGWMVGDSLAADIGGGRAAGLNTVWIDRGQGRPGRAEKPDQVVGDVREAIRFLLRGG